MPASLKNFVRHLLLIAPVSILTGTVIAIFLYLLNWAIHFRFAHNWLLYLLPAAGLLIYLIYTFYARSTEKGNNLIIEEIHTPGAGIPKRMAPVILLTTVITHLFGGSAGREGTAVQIGGSIAAMFGKWFKLHKEDTALLLTAGIAAGFGAVFGTPVTGAVFAIEVLTLGRMKLSAFIPALAASFLADFTVHITGVHHTIYRIDELDTSVLPATVYLQGLFLLLLKVIAAGAAFGLASLLFAEFTHKVRHTANRLISVKWLIPVLGGLLIIILTLLNGKPDYLSLGVDAEYPAAVTIPSAFHTAGADTWSWLWKTIYTAITLGTGFKGGEVTPLFYIGATLGNTLAALMNAPVSLFAALGFIAVFAGATKTPLACTIMGAELFGMHYIAFFGLACFIAYFCSGRSGIYTAQTAADLTAYTGDSPAADPLSSKSRLKNYSLSKFEKYRYRVIKMK
jgi:H+/Cl- antiporter ClcA